MMTLAKFHEIHLSPIPPTPQLPDLDRLKENLVVEIDMVTLVPYTCTHLRVAIFPKVVNM